MLRFGLGRRAGHLLHGGRPAVRAGGLAGRPAGRPRRGRAGARRVAGRGLHPGGRAQLPGRSRARGPVRRRRARGRGAGHRGPRAARPAPSRVGVAMSLDEDALRDVRLVALVHDAGRRSIPDALLSKRESLTPVEWAVIQRGTLVGQRMLAQHAVPGRAVEGVGRGPRALGRHAGTRAAWPARRSRCRRGSSASAPPTGRCSRGRPGRPAAGRTSRRWPSFGRSRRHPVRPGRRASPPRRAAPGGARPPLMRRRLATT